MQSLDWEASYNVLWKEFDTAMSKLRATVSAMDVSRMGDGAYTATVRLSVEPYQFTSEPAHSAAAAKAKLMFTALKYVDTVLGYRIIDLNHVLREHIVSHIDQFDHRMELVWSCGKRMCSTGSTLHNQFIRMKTDVRPANSPTPQADEVNIRINHCANIIAQFAYKLEVAMVKLTDQKVQCTPLQTRSIELLV